MISVRRGIWPATLAVGILLAACGKQTESTEPVVRLETDMRCDLEPGCVAAAAGFSANFLIGPNPLALKPFPVRVRFAGNTAATAVSVQFSMTEMNMGINRYRLVDDGGGVWRADVTLPICVSGRSDWVAAFEFLTDGRRIGFAAPFTVGK